MPQGTIKTFDPRTGSGVILDDAKTELLYDRVSWDGTGAREFRLGQRVRFDVEGEGSRARVRNLRIISF